MELTTRQSTMTASNEPNPRTATTTRRPLISFLCRPGWAKRDIKTMAAHFEMKRATTQSTTPARFACGSSETCGRRLKVESAACSYLVQRKQVRALSQHINVFAQTLSDCNVPRSELAEGKYLGIRKSATWSAIKGREEIRKGFGCVRPVATRRETHGRSECHPVIWSVQIPSYPGPHKSYAERVAQT